MKRLPLLAAALALLLVGHWSAESQRRWTFPRLPFLEAPVDASYIPTPIKSLQQVSVTLNNQTSNTSAALSPAVVAANSLLIYQGRTSNNTPTGIGAYTFVRGTLTNSTTVTATMGATTSGQINTWNGVVVEFLGNFVKSSQCSTIVIPDGSASATATITAVTQAKTALVSTGESVVVVGNIDPSNQETAVTLTNATTITASKASTTATVTTATAGYCYVEFR